MKRIIPALLALSFLLSAASCSVRVTDKTETNDIDFTPPAKATEEVTEAAAEEETEAPAEKPTLSKEKAGSEDSPHSDISDADDDEDFTSGRVTEEKSKEITSIMMSVKPDADGFIIKDGVVYDYKGTSPEIHIPEGITKISEHGFWSNDTIEAVYLPSSVRTIGAGAFWSCDRLKYVKAEEGLEGIAGSAFWSCTALETAELPASVERIGDAVFWAIDGLTVHAPEGSYVSDYCKNSGIPTVSETSVYTPLDRENTILGSQYAYGEFREFTIGENITGIEANAFEYCENLESIFIPSNVRYIAQDAFEYCYGLRTVTIDGCKEVRGEAFEYCEALEEVRINEGTESIGESAFAYCEKLTDVYLPASVTSIDKRAFEYTGELTLHVPAGSYAETFAVSMKIPYDNNI